MYEQTGGADQDVGEAEGNVAEKARRWPITIQA